VGNQISEFKASSARVEASPQNVGMCYYPVTHHHSPEEENPQILQLALQWTQIVKIILNQSTQPNLLEWTENRIHRIYLSTNI